MIHSKIALLGAVAALSSIVAAHPLTDATLENLFKRATVSPDNTCGLLYNGANKGYVCDTTTAGTCCSQYGYCGATSDYCGTGCQSAYGTCATGDGSSAPNVTGSTDPNLCGPTNAGSSCASGLCCSQSGYCGNTTDYCDSGCQSAYGVCDGGVGTGGNGLCGPMNNGEICPTGQCCSPAGYCGTTEDYCASPSCLNGYGTCDSDQTPPGASTASIPRPVLGSVPYGVDIYDCNDPGHIACTFDDGPSMYTNDLLNLLASYGVQCTFFITSNNNGKGQIDLNATYTADVQRMITDGHQVASHTWSHQNLSSLTVAGIQTEMIKNEMSLRNIIGKIPTYMRPPFSECDSDCHTVMTQLGYHIVYFDLDTQDYLHDDPSLIQQSKDIVHSTLSTANSANIDFLAISHDIHYQTVYNFTNYFLDQMNTYGFKATTVGTCLQDPQANWYRSATVSNVSSTSTSASSTSSSASSLSSSLSSSSSSSSSSSATTTTSSTSSKTSTSSTSTVSSTTSSTTMSSTSSTSMSSSTSMPTTSTKTSTSSTGTSTSSTGTSTSSTGTSTSSTGTSASSIKTSASVSSTMTSTSSTKISTSSTSSTRASTSTAPTNPSCAGTQVGNYCCQPSRGFQDMGGCWESYANCMLNVGECMSSNRNGDWSKCNDYNTNTCNNLLSYCEKCDWNSCSSSNYHG